MFGIQVICCVKNPVAIFQVYINQIVALCIWLAGATSQEAGCDTIATRTLKLSQNVSLKTQYCLVGVMP